MIAIIVLFFLSLGGVISVKAYNSYNVKQNLDLGNKYLSDGKYEQAILAFEKVISIEPSNVEARVGLSKAYVALKRFKSAEKVLSEGIRIMEKKPDSRLYSALADVYLKQDKVQDAIKILDEGYSATHDKGIKEQLNDISSRITIQSESIDVQVGKSLSLKLYATDSDGKLLELTGNWMLQNSSLGALTSSKGFNVGFNANSVGSEVIIVKIGSITKRITINVKQHILQSIDIVADKENPVVGESINLKAVGKDQSGKEMDINPTWSVNNDTGSLANPQGTTNTLKLNKNGKVGVNVSQDKVKGSKTITVNKKKYSVATSVSGRGSITASHNADKYDEGTNVKYTAVPQNGWVFKGWQGSVSGSANPITVNINANKTVKAVFVQKQFTLNTNVRGQGTVRRDVNRSSYTNSSVVTLTTSAPSGWKFDHWTGDAAGNSRSIKVLMNSNKNVTAVFVQVPQAPVKSQPILSAPKPEQKPEIKPEPKPAPIPKPESVQEPAPKPEPKPEPLSKPTPAPTYELKTDSSGQGTVTRDVSGDKYQSDSIVTLTATAEEGWYFDHWEGDVTGTTNSVQVTMDKSKTVKAVFVQDEYELTTSTEGQGTVTISPEQDKYLSGSEVTLTATAEEGWYFDHWEGDVTGTTNSVQVTMDKSKTVKAVFVQDEYELTTSTEGQGTVTISPEQDKYLSGSEVTLTATAEEGWHFDHWEGDVTGTANPVQVTMDKSKTVKAVFVQDEYELTTSTEGQGTVTISPEQDKYLSGSEVTLTATAEEGWHFDHWEGDVTGTTNSVQVTMDKSKTVKAVFVQDTIINGKVTDETNDHPIESVTVNVRSGNDVHEGKILETITTDANGKYTINNLSAGNYTLQLSAPGYNTRYYNVIATTGQTIETKSELLPVINDDSIRSILTWNDSVSDLDTHLVTPKQVEVKYSNEDDGESAKLNQDVTDGNGPETITIYNQQPGSYLYSIYNYSGSPEIKTSNAGIKVYRGNTLINTFNISDAEGTGRYWNVFSIDGDTITSINSIADSNKYSLTTEVEGQGTVNENSYVQSNEYTIGSTVTLTAAPDTGWHFDHWEDASGEQIGTDSTLSLTMDSDKTVKAVFLED
ncbi:hypothetical protein CPAST_c06890 [Clostridium pasteurianum DSM 525 = ATCC 6013]|uniref:Tetratricopeptide repeat-containing protein n=3 Tax=Clostridium pasteurianum TaxID=1501 RepID=A0A0H3J0C4_CLOPA|nr:hypothetical protein CPAST_c06890 [Clostridium pasteurianum DSM 525 = ATCC 6013]AJA50777.1 hypothetical protein CLPA_c06890 [Clostridium pasteurianum DSM 525 = ATCC 6013]AOZ74183.1 hypothetical protein AQ983_03315 [Clostridium pasteurianum DSM 525 = ATCC 6013]AOZ77981.1 hypothetical protein AQ984_03315 [Clostridium pasteurianum]KRU13213.1 Tetratricopeptide repeat-containing protein [Clostridium pasteurianum DSM 525 = ATCC 6013]